MQEIKFKLEKDIQKITENNLETILNLKLVKSEFTLHNFRIDTLAFDEESKSFVIIEYKKDKSFSVVDQGYAYLSLMLNNKADFILEYNESLNSNLKRNDVDWSQSKVIFISPSFTDYQKESINFKDLPIELWEVKYFNNQTISYIPQKASGATESIKIISKKSKTIEKVSKEIKVYTESYHINDAGVKIISLYNKFKTAILLISDSISVKPTKKYISFKVNKKTICDFHLYKTYLKIWINLKKGELVDSKKITTDVSDTGHWGKGAYQIQISNEENLEYIVSLIKESYNKAWGVI
ncbi:MAG: hypothetical protein A2000_14500 [Ignavibacteria bacterium GWB2_36_8]|nr:MAG: hypothetical protein A2000_14500 [Ignavibacteria bacterium GWB2_36_8]OGU48530.1 MAG: hypothetical protein A2080_07930 [Ignavibacteria bacterium GWC2_36_12]